MSLLSDEQREALQQAGLRTPLVSSTCIGCGSCVIISPTVFEMNDDGVSVVKEAKNYENIWVDESIAACPSHSISWK